MSPKDYDEPLDTEALGWVGWLAQTGKITPDAYFDIAAKEFAR